MPRIRDAGPADRESVAALLEELGYPAEADGVARRIASLAGREDYAVYVAETEGDVVGLGCAHVFPILHADEPLALITALVVAEKAQGGGAGRELVAKLEEFARSHGCVRIAVTTASHRDGAHAFYERLGYQHTGRRYVKQPL
jgi:GNAT superfamily N-acetyltransferase